MTLASVNGVQRSVFAVCPVVSQTLALILVLSLSISCPVFDVFSVTVFVWFLLTNWKSTFELKLN